MPHAPRPALRLELTAAAARHPDKSPGQSAERCGELSEPVPCEDPAEEMFIRISKANDACARPAPLCPRTPARVEGCILPAQADGPRNTRKLREIRAPGMLSLAWKRSVGSLTHVGWPAAQDGRQAMTGAIGLPEFFMDESKWQLILLVYFGALIFGLPIMVWRW